MAWAWLSSIPAPINAMLPAPIDHLVGGDPNPYTFARNPLRRGHQWHQKFDWNALPYNVAAAFSGFLSVGRGGIQPYAVPIYGYRKKRGSKTGTVTLNGAHAAGAENLDITGGSGTFSVGDWFHIYSGTDPWAHVCFSAESGGVISINPPLRMDFAGGAPLHHIDEGYILDTMELPPAFDMPVIEVSSNPRYSRPFSVEFVTALP